MNTFSVSYILCYPGNINIWAINKHNTSGQSSGSKCPPS